MIDWLSDLRQAKQASLMAPLLDEDLRERNAVTLALLMSAASLIDVADQDALMQRLCEVIVASTRHVPLAWVWVGEPDADIIRPQFAAGRAKAYVDRLEIQRNWLTRRGPAFQALLNGKPDLHSIGRFDRLFFRPWGGQAGHQFQIAAALPIRVPEADRRGLLVFYADDEVYFQNIGVEPFQAAGHLAGVALEQMSRTRQLMIQAMTDSLTGLLNRRSIVEHLAQEISKVRRQGGTFSVLSCDFDYFKQVNDTYGHAVGDLTLITLTAAMRKSLRQEDQFGRLGGEEFLCVLPQTDTAAAHAVAEKLRAVVESTQIPAAGKTFSITASFGVATYIPEDGEPDGGKRRLLARVDAALYASKANGRNRVST